VKIACLWVSHLPVKVELHRYPHLKRRPIILARASGSRRVVLDASPQAVDVLPAMPLQQALSRCKEAVLLDADLPLYRRVQEQFFDSLEQRGAEVEEAQLGLAYMKLDGLEAMHGGEARLITSLLNAVPSYLMPRIGMATGKFPAYLAATTCEPYGVMKVPEEPREFLALLSVDLLPVAWEIRSRLHSFGLHTLGQVAALPIGPMQAQFGRVGKTMWELANGIDYRPLMSRHLEDEVEEQLSFVSPVGALEAMVTAADVLLARAFRHREMRGRLARVCTLEGEVFRAPTWLRRMSFKQPISDARHGLTLVKHSLECQPPPGALESLSLTLSGLTGDAGRQESLFHDVRRRENLQEALSQMEARFGRRPPIFQVREVEPWSRLPERRQALVPFVP
jgi:hypothetical protein